MAWKAFFVVEIFNSFRVWSTKLDLTIVAVYYFILQLPPATCIAVVSIFIAVVVGIILLIARVLDLVKVSATMLRYAI